MPLDPNEKQILASYKNRIEALTQQVNHLAAAIQAANSRPTSVQEEIDAIPGRRIEGALVGSVTFTAADVGKRAAPIIFQVSQDGPFVMTHYPMAVWYATAPDNTPNLNRWRPVRSWPLPTQQIPNDIIDIMYELNDGGAGRLSQNAPRGPMLSQPDNIVPCPVPTLWSPNASIVFQPTYMNLNWGVATPAVTQGVLHVDLIGYRIVNL